MRFFLSVLFLILTVSSSAQTLYKPRDVRQAFRKQTRSEDGRPGKKYWQNRARYTINITATPPERTIRGSEEIVYFNNSPDTLTNLAFKLLLNIHKPGAPRLGGATQSYLTTGVHIDSFVVNGRAQPWDNNPWLFTTVPVSLRQPLKAHDSIRLSIKWHYDVSKRSGREGMIDSTTFFLAYFYPRVAVYDDYHGWDYSSFNDALEFYSDFNDYTVNIQVPKNYLVWGTGTLVNPSAVLQPAYVSKYKQSLTASQPVRIVRAEDLKAGNITTQSAVNTWRFTSANIPDVAFGISDHFVWDGASVVVDDKTGRRASVQAAYNDTARDYHRMVEFGKQSLDWLSHSWPGIPYPYEKTTIFQGYAGMEYPMMANDESYEDTTFSLFVALHELAHTYMPFYMGINETRYGFMDEGWATTFELLFNRDKMGTERAEEDFRNFRVKEWIHDTDPEADMPIITPGTSLSGSGLGPNQYGKAALGYLAVKDLLGDTLFRKCLHEYMNRWNGKHPLPWDFFNTFNTASGINLNWFWNNWFFSSSYIDLAVTRVSKTLRGYSVSVQNIGGMASPFDVVVTYLDKTTERFHFTPAVWQANTQQANVSVATKKMVASVQLQGGIFMDADASNNTWSK